MLIFFAVLISLLCLVIGLLAGWTLAQSKIERLAETLKARDKALLTLQNNADQIRIESQARPAHTENLLVEREAHINNLENNLSVLRSKLKERERDYQTKEKDFQRIAAMTAGLGTSSNRLYERDAKIGKLELDFRELAATNIANVESLNASRRQIAELEARIQELETENAALLKADVQESSAIDENNVSENLETAISSNYMQHYAPKYD